MEASATTAFLGDDAVVGAVDYKGRPVSRSATGGWRSALFIIGVEIAERFAYYGIASNLISYLTGPLRQSTAEAAENVNVWSGVSSMLPLLGAFVADSYLGRYRTILLASLLYILGLCLLTLSAMLPSLRPPQCPNPQLDPTSCPTPTRFQIFFFFSALYLVAFAQGGHKPCVQAFGADQFDSRHPKESKSKSSFFNWWYFGLCGGTAISLWILNYIQENVGWGLGFGIPCVSMVVALLVFLLGTSTYRYTSLEERNPFARIGQVFLVAVRRSFARQGTSSASSARDGGKTDLEGGSSLFKYLDQTVVPTFNGSENEWSTCSSTQVEEAKAVLQLVPIWATCLLYGVVFAQSSTFFTKQGSTMDRSLGPHLKIPAATLQTFISLSIVLVIPFYDRLLVPAARALTGIPSGITMLQRIGFGMFLSVVSMMVAAVVESWRLAIARDAGLIDRPGEFVPMSVWWLAPQYVLYGIADVFTMVGLQEFFYDQVPEGLRSVGLSLYLSIFGIGSFISGFLISVIDQVTGGGGGDGESWFATNLNRAHLDYFYWLLAGISALELGLYIYFSKSYVYYVGARLRYLLGVIHFMKLFFSFTRFITVWVI